MPLQATAGAATYDAFGGVVTAANYIEDVFQTWLYTGNGSTQTITNGVDLSTKGGLVWTKIRTTSASNHLLTDTARGGSTSLVGNLNSASQPYGAITSFNSNGFSLSSNYDSNGNAEGIVAWTFRKQPKFFDVVTWTGNGSNRTISHSLGSVPGCIIVKRTDTTADWQVYHRSLANTEYMVLNTTAAKATGTTRWNSTTPTSTVFSLGTDTTVNATGGTYVAYLFAHDAGGFGASGTDNVISCGSFTNSSSSYVTTTIGYEAQWLMVKRTDSTGNWFMYDNMRGMTVPDNGNGKELVANTASAEVSGSNVSLNINATGFSTFDGANSTYIYIAIRRGPMRTPTTGTSVYDPEGIVTVVSNPTIQTGFVTDMAIAKLNGVQEWLLSDRLRNAVLYPNTTNSEGSLYGTAGPGPFDVQNGYKITTLSGNYALWAFRRAPGFFDVVCYTGDGSSNLTVNHNLAAVPELLITKRRNNGTDSWFISALFGVSSYQLGAFDGGAFGAQTYNVYYLVSKPTSTSFAVRDSGFSNHGMNVNGSTYVNYLFATVAGVSKVGSYTGTGTTLQVNCGFTAGARFVLIKRADSAGDWYVWDSARGIVAGNDPYLLLNASAAEVTSTDYVDTYSAGFEISSTAPADINANGGTFIFLAIA